MFDLKRPNAMLMALFAGLTAMVCLWPGFSFADDSVVNDEQPRTGCGQPQAGLPEADMLAVGKRYRLEVASTPHQAEIGLMHRTYLPKRHGMLFQFDEARPVAFWMKNTLIPLDMLFVRDGKVVSVTHSAQPCVKEPCAIYPSGSPVDMVVELPAGTARQDQLQVGMPIRLISVSKTPSPSLKVPPIHEK